MATLNIKNFPDKLYRLVKRLAERENRSVSQQVVHLLSTAVEEPRQESILDLRGLGKEAWLGVDATEHVETERKSWD